MIYLAVERRWAEGGRNQQTSRNKADVLCVGAHRKWEISSTVRSIHETQVDGRENGNLDWSQDDVDAVARYLDAHYYRYPLHEK